MDPFAIITALGLPWVAAAFLTIWAGTCLYLVWHATRDGGLKPQAKQQLHSFFDWTRQPYLLLTRQIEDGVPDALLPSLVKDDPPPSGFRARFFWNTFPRIRDAGERARLKANPWSWPIMDLAMRIAIAYPLVLALTQWAFSGGTATEVAGLILFPAGVHWGFRVALFGLLVIMIASRIVESASTREKVVSRARMVFWISFAVAFALSVAVAVALVFAVALAGPVAFAFAGAVAFAFAGAVAFAFAGPVAFAFAFTLAFAGPVAFAVVVALAVAVAGLVYRAALRGSAFWGYAVLILITVTAALAALSILGAGDPSIGLVFAFVLLPAINVVFDWLSYGTNIWLLRTGRRKKGIWPLLCGLLDIAAALAIFFLLSVTLLIGIDLINTLQGEALIDLPLLLGQLANDPMQHLWIIAMVASTLLPTLIHVGISFFSAFVAVPAQRITSWIDMLANRDSGIDNDGGAFFLSLYLSAGVTIFFAGPYFLAGALMQWGPVVRDYYITAMVHVAHGFGFL